MNKQIKKFLVQLGLFLLFSILYYLIAGFYTTYDTSKWTAEGLAFTLFFETMLLISVFIFTFDIYND